MLYQNLMLIIQCILRVPSLADSSPGFLWQYNFIYRINQNRIYISSWSEYEYQYSLFIYIFWKYIYGLLQALCSVVHAQSRPSRKAQSICLMMDPSSLQRWMGTKFTGWWVHYSQHIYPNQHYSYHKWRNCVGSSKDGTIFGSRVRGGFEKKYHSKIVSTLYGR